MIGPRTIDVDGEQVELEVEIRTWQDTKWLCVRGVVQPARGEELLPFVVANGTRTVGVFEVTREGDVWLRHSSLLGSVDVDAIARELAGEIVTRRRSMPRSKT